jgi:hypothetical protein
VAGTVGWLLAATLVFLFGSTVARLTDTYTGSPKALYLGIAEVTDCQEHGPISVWGLGISYSCQARVRWSDGELTTESFLPGQLRPGERRVPVFLSQDGGQIAISPGRNDSARNNDLGRVLFSANVLLLLVLLLRAWGAAFGVRANLDRHNRRWPITRADLAAVPRGAGYRRMLLLGLVFLGTLVYVPLSVIPLLDAPRADPFVSPVPWLQSAWLIDWPTYVIWLFLCPITLGTFAGLRIGIRGHARVIRYGEEYLTAEILTLLTRRARRVRRRGVRDHVARLIARQPRQILVQRVLAGVLLVLALWNAVGVVRVVPAGTDLVLWLAALRDAVVLTAVAVIVWCTIEPWGTRLTGLLELNSARNSGSEGNRPVDHTVGPANNV